MLTPQIEKPIEYLFFTQTGPPPRRDRGPIQPVFPVHPGKSSQTLLYLSKLLQGFRLKIAHTLLKPSNGSRQESQTYMRLHNVGPKLAVMRTFRLPQRGQRVGSASS